MNGFRFRVFLVDTVPKPPVLFEDPAGVDDVETSAEFKPRRLVLEDRFLPGQVAVRDDDSPLRIARDDLPATSEEISPIDFAVVLDERRAFRQIQRVA